MLASTMRSIVPRQSGMRNERGSIVVLTAVVLTMLLGVTAFALDASFMYNERNRLYAAADAAAKSAAVEYHLSASANLQAFAEHEVQNHGFTLGGPLTVVVNRPPASGSFAGFANYVEVIVSKDTNTFLGNILGIASMTPSARAVAGTGNPVNCLVTQQDLSLGNSEITLNGCGAAVGGGLNGGNPNSEINGTPTPDVGVTGPCTGTCGAMGTLHTGAPKPIDPLSTLTPPANPGGCIAGVGTELWPGCYTSIADTVTTLHSGGNNIYYITGPVTFADLNASAGVMLFLTGAGQLVATLPNNNRSLTVSAPTSGTYSGIAIYSDTSTNFDVGNQFTLTVTGAIYMPNTDVTTGNAMTITSTGCTLFIARSIYFPYGSGNYLSNLSCASMFSGAAFLGISLAE